MKAERPGVAAGPSGRKLGVFGGTFDPLHIGHLIVADDVAGALGLDRVLFIPAGTHPLKRSKVVASGELRLRMIIEAIAASDRFAPDDRELRRGGPSYTVDTLRELQEEHPRVELYLLVGSDILREIHRWRAPDEIAERARITVMTRAGMEPPANPAMEYEYRRVQVTHIGISSTEIRRRVVAAEPYRYLVPDPVHRIIEDHSLYK